MKKLKLEKLGQEALSVIMGGANDRYIVRTTQTVTTNKDGSITITTTIWYSDGTVFTERVTSSPTTDSGGTTLP